MEQISAQKYVSVLFSAGKIGSSFRSSATNFSCKEKAENTAKFGSQTAPFGPWFWQIQNSNFESLSQHWELEYTLYDEMVLDQICFSSRVWDFNKQTQKIIFQWYSERAWSLLFVSFLELWWFHLRDDSLL